MRFLAIVFILFNVQVASAQVMIEFNGTKTLHSQIKEVTTWEDGVKVAAESFAGDQNVIVLSKKNVSITTNGKKTNYPVKEALGDQWGNFNFVLKDGGKIIYSTKRNLVQILPFGENTQTVYYID